MTWFRDLPNIKQKCETTNRAQPGFSWVRLQCLGLHPWKLFWRRSWGFIPATVVLAGVGESEGGNGDMLLTRILLVYVSLPVSELHSGSFPSAVLLMLMRSQLEVYGPKTSTWWQTMSTCLLFCPLVSPPIHLPDVGEILSEYALKLVSFNGSNREWWASEAH